MYIYLFFIQKGATILQHFGSTITALQTIYPSIGLQKELFPFYKGIFFSVMNFNLILLFAENDWTKVETRRTFFDNFARKNGFDPLVPSNWNSVLRKDIVKEVRITICIF